MKDKSHAVAAVAATAFTVRYKPIIILLLAAVLCLPLSFALVSIAFLLQFVACACLGASVLLLCYFPWRGQRLRRAARIGRRLIWAGLCLFVVSLIWVEALIIAAAGGSGEPESDYLLVLGAAVEGYTPSATLASRLETAAAYLTRHPDSVAVLSGGQGPGEAVSEARAMRDWLAAYGIAPERLYLEDASTSTAENFAYSLPLLSELNGGALPVPLVISNGYHLYRAGLIAQQQGLTQIETLVAPSPPLPLLTVNSYLREYFALVKFWLLSP